MLGKAIVQEFKKINRIFSSHLVAYTAFYLLRKQNPKLDLFSILRLPEEEQVIKYEDFKSCFSKLRDIVFKMHQQGLVGLAPHMKKEVDEVIRHGITNVGMYHIKRPLIFTESGDITTQDLNTLFYYYNRMKGYGLQKHIR